MDMMKDLMMDLKVQLDGGLHGKLDDGHRW